LPRSPSIWRAVVADVGRDDLQRPVAIASNRWRQALQIVDGIERFGDGGRGDDDAVVGEKAIGLSPSTRARRSPRSSSAAL
jgi:hypothetical protein